MLSVSMDQFGRETCRHYTLSDKTIDVPLDRLGKLFETMKLSRFGTFEEFMKDPDLFYFRASARGDFWK